MKLLAKLLPPKKGQPTSVQNDQNPVYLLDESRSLGDVLSAVVAGCWVHPHAVAKATQTFSHAQSKHVCRMFLDPHSDGLSSKGWASKVVRSERNVCYNVVNLGRRPWVCGAPRAAKPEDRRWSTTKAWGTVSQLAKRPMLHLFRWSHRLNVGEQAALSIVE